MVKIKNALLVCGSLVLSLSSALAAPSVKMLGGGNSLPGIAKNTVVRNSSNQTSASSGVRVSSVRAAKPISAKIAQDNKTVSDVNVARLSVGKYLHNAGVNSGKIKPINTSGSSVSNTDIDELNEQINQLNTQVTELSNQLTELNNRIGLDVAEKDAGADTNNFINHIEVGEDGKTLKVGRSNVKIPVGSENGTPVASLWVEE